MAVVEMVDNGHAVLFDSGGSYAFDKKTGHKLHFRREGRGWDLDLELEAPATANRIAKEMLAQVTDNKNGESEAEIDLVKLFEFGGDADEEDMDFRMAARPFRA